MKTLGRFRKIILILVAFTLLAGAIPRVGFEASAGNYAETRLSGVNKAIYDSIREKASSLAANGGSAILKITGTALSGLTYNLSGTSDLGSAISAKFQEDVNTWLILECLLADCPYEFFWYDKTVGLRYSFSYSYNSNYTSCRITSVTYYFSVISAYQGEGYSQDNPVVKSELEVVSSALANAQAVVDANAEKSDYEKLVAYRDYICDAVSYDFSAISGSLVYGDQWQLVYVFDNDSSTNVVCEGYSKAFQYLCDLSTFDNSSLVCYTVTGIAQGSSVSGSHMWNLISVDGNSYMVDITNSDSGSAGEDGSLFLASAPVNGNASGYSYTVSGFTMSFTYDENAIDLFSPEIRTLSQTEFPIPVPAPDFTTSDVYDVSENKISKITAGTNVESFLAGLSAGEFCKIYDGESEVTGASNVGTGMVVKIMDGDTEKASYTVVVAGDTDGDGVISVSDASIVLDYIRGQASLDDVYFEAACVEDAYTEINILDVATIVNMIFTV